MELIRRIQSLYDIVLHIDNLKVDDAVEILADIAQRPCFQTTRRISNDDR